MWHRKVARDGRMIQEWSSQSRGKLRGDGGDVGTQMIDAKVGLGVEEGKPN